MLHIGLTEPVVFLRHSSDLTASGRRRQVTSETTPSILRGILTLKLNKPTKIKNVEISIIGTSRTHWPEGIGPRRAEILEEHTVLSAKATLFQAGEHSPSAPTRRTKSVGPGVLSGFESDRESDDDDETRGRRRRSNPGTRDTSRSQTPERVPARERGSSVDQWQLGRRRYPMTELPAYAVPSPVYTPEPSLRELPEEDHPSSEHLSPGQTLEDFRNVLRATTDHFVQQPGHTTRRSTSGVRSTASSRPNTSASRSRPPSSLFLHDPNALSPTASRLLVEPRAPDTGSPHRLDDGLVITPISSPIAAADHRLSFTQSTAGPSGRRVSPPETPPLSRAPTREEVPGSQSSKAKQKRFSFGAAWHEMKELVMPSSRRQSMATERPHSPRVAPASPRAPTLVVSPNVFTSKREGSRGRDRTVVGKLSGALGLEEDHKDKKEDWEEFRKGTYNWPISFTIPPGCPPTIRCDFGSVTYRIKAHVTRVGAFTSNLDASTEVTFISCPGEDDTEESESIIVEREWENHLRYLIALSGKSFPVGGTMPLHLTLMPMSKISIYRLSAILEEKVDYIAHSGRISRHDPPKRHELLGVKPGDKQSALLPIFSETTDAALSSPLASYVDEEDPSDVAGQLLTPSGPWSLHFHLKVPDCSTKIHFTNRHSKAKIVVSHSLKVIMRVDRGDETELDSKGKRKQFDIIVEVPVQLLSCRCNPEWMSLPTYSLFPLDTSQSQSYGCVCQANNPHRQNNSNGGNDALHSLDMDYLILGGAGIARASGGFTPRPPEHPLRADQTPLVRGPDALDDRNRQYAALVSGIEREDGERPPTYEDATVY